MEVTVIGKLNIKTGGKITYNRRIGVEYVINRTKGIMPYH
jgi:hypothetical protein